MVDRLFSEQECRLLEEVMRYRRDVRGNRFIQEPVSKAAIERILDAALRAPSETFWESVIRPTGDAIQKLSV